MSYKKCTDGKTLSNCNEVRFLPLQNISNSQIPSKPLHKKRVQLDSLKSSKFGIKIFWCTNGQQATLANVYLCLEALALHWRRASAKIPFKYWLLGSGIDTFLEAGSGNIGKVRQRLRGSSTRLLSPSLLALFKFQSFGDIYDSNNCYDIAEFSFCTGLLTQLHLPQCVVVAVCISDMYK